MFLKILCVLFATFSNAKVVKTLNLSENQIYPLKLALGKTTLIRFEEKPLRLIIGNKNYFNVESNDLDIALQPLQKVETNLFVYTTKQTFSFNLKVCESCENDDFVKIESKVIREKRFPEKKEKRTKDSLLLSKLIFKDFILYVQKVSSFDNSAFVDIFIESTNEKIEVSEISLKIEIERKNFTNFDLVFDGVPKNMKGRIYFPLKPRNDVKLIFSYKAKKQIFTIPRRKIL